MYYELVRFLLSFASVCGVLGKLHCHFSHREPHCMAFDFVFQQTSIPHAVGALQFLADGLWEGLREGLIDTIGTDHSPAPPALKHLDSGDLNRAWGGIASLQVALPAVWTEAHRRGFTIGDLARWMARRPAELLAISSSKGAIEAGRDADLVVFNP